MCQPYSPHEPAAAVRQQQLHQARGRAGAARPQRHPGAGGDHCGGGGAGAAGERGSGWAPSSTCMRRQQRARGCGGPRDRRCSQGLGGKDPFGLAATSSPAARSRPPHVRSAAARTRAMRWRRTRSPTWPGGREGRRRAGRRAHAVSEERVRGHRRWRDHGRPAPALPFHSRPPPAAPPEVRTWKEAVTAAAALELEPSAWLAALTCGDRGQRAQGRGSGRAWQGRGGCPWQGRGGCPWQGRGGCPGPAHTSTPALTMHSWPCTAGHAQLAMHSWPCTAGHAQLTMHSWPCTAGRAADLRGGGAGREEECVVGGQGGAARARRARQRRHGHEAGGHARRSRQRSLWRGRGTEGREKGWWRWGEVLGRCGRPGVARRPLRGGARGVAWAGRLSPASPAGSPWRWR
jgi:hypothetical protein